MRITVKRGNKNVIPKLKIPAAAKKLAMYEDTGKESEQVVEIYRLYSERCAEVGNLYSKLNLLKTEINIVLDDIDGQIIDDPISEVRERLNGLLD